MRIITKYISICVFLLFTQLSFSQELKEYLIEISDINFVPKYVAKFDKFEIDSNLSNASAINDILSDLLLYDCIYLNDIDKNLTTKTVQLFSSVENETEVTSLINSLLSYSPYLNSERLESYELLYTPNDFENIAPFSQNNLSTNNQEELVLIRAEEAWDITHGNPNVMLGIADLGYYVDHPDLTTEVAGGIGQYDNGTSGSNHGTFVAGLASAATDNGEGISSIGFDTSLLLGPLSVQTLKNLSDLGARVVNGSFGSPTLSINPNASNQTRINDIVAAGNVVVCAAGNGPYTGGTTGINGMYTNEQYASRYYLPASYKNVISVTSVSNKNDIGFDEDADPATYDNWKDVHLIKRNGTPNYSGTSIPINEKNVSMQHNDSVDISVPSHRGSPYLHNSSNPNDQYREGGSIGTSVAAPIVTGTIGLMFSVNYCLEPNEIETILKLTAVKIDTIPENLPFYGRLGAGRLDAYEAVKMAYDMKQPFGTVEVKNRILYRPWFYKLATAPYEIKMTNNNVTQDSKLKFRARNNIEIISGTYFPDNGYIDLQIDPGLTTCEVPDGFTIGGGNESEDRSSNLDSNKNTYLVTPTLVRDYFKVEEVGEFSQKMHTVTLYNLFNTKVSEKIISSSNLNYIEFVDVGKLKAGVYILKIHDSDKNELYTTKIIKN